MAQRIPDLPLVEGTFDVLRIASLTRATSFRPRSPREPEKARPGPLRPGDLPGDHGKRAPALASPKKAILGYEHLVTGAPPFAHEPRSGPELGRSSLGQIALALERLGQVGKPPSRGRGQSPLAPSPSLSSRMAKPLDRKRLSAPCTVCRCQPVALASSSAVAPVFAPSRWMMRPSLPPGRLGSALAGAGAAAAERPRSSGSSV
jgi:hypothetical protein